MFMLACRFAGLRQPLHTWLEYGKLHVLASFMRATPARFWLICCTGLAPQLTLPLAGFLLIRNAGLMPKAQRGS